MAKKSSPADAGYINAVKAIEVCRKKRGTTLNLSDNKLTALPTEIAQLTALTELYLHNNQLTELPPQIAKLTALTVLNLGGNQLTAVPPKIGQLTALTTLDLSVNRLTALPPEIAKLTALTALYLHGNPRLEIPDSVLGPTFSEVVNEKKLAARPQGILNYYFAQRKAEAAGTLQRVNEIKAMLVGRGGAGKTSLRRFFMGEAHNTGENETPGIVLDRFPLTCASGSLTVRLWDFAGQEITHALHQFFLTDGCVYVLVLDPRSNTEMQDAEYWLGLLQRYATGAPVLVALNRQDARQGGYDVDRRVLKERFPVIHSFTPTICENRKGCEELRNRLCEAIETLKETEPPHLKVPNTWLNVMADCAKEAPGRQHLSLDEFKGICSKRGETDAGQQESLARLLHKLGAVLHFVDEPRLRDTTVLQPHWVTDAVYRLLRYKDRPGSDGTLSLAEALQALPLEKEHEARYFLRLMERFEMCFPLDDQEGELPTRWLIPGALGEFQPEGVITADWQKPGSVRLRYVYDPLPEGVLPRFIVMTHLLSEGKPRWRNGVVLEDGQAAALVRRGKNRNHVEVNAFGPDADSLRLLEIIQGTFDRIHVDLPDPKPVAEIELARLPGNFRSVADLEAAERLNIPVAVKTESVETQVEPALELNRSSDLEARTGGRIPLKAFLSYSHKDKNAKNTFQDNLTVMTKKKFITQWHDGLIETGTLWREDIEKNLAEMDVFIGLLTNAFLASDFIDTVELKAAREKIRSQGKDFVFVLILVDDISLNGLDLEQYQILKPGGKPVCKHASRKAGFNQAQKELELLFLRIQAQKNPYTRKDFNHLIEPVITQLDTLSLKNFCCFEDKQLEFTERFNLLIGLNGSGKTSILNGIAIGLGAWFLGLTHTNEKKAIETKHIRMRYYREDETYLAQAQTPTIVSCQGKIMGRIGKWSRELENEKTEVNDDTGWIENIASEISMYVEAREDVILPVISYYGTGRLWLSKPPIATSTLRPTTRFQGYYQCLDPALDEKTFLAWFKTMEFQGKEEDKFIPVLECVRQAILGCVENATRVWFHIARDELLLSVSDNILSFNSLSDGYRNILAMVADIAVRCAMLNPSLRENAARDTPGVVLIDEIDLHLHPRWQRRIVTDLIKAFPRIQFIVTTHSPFIIQSLLPEHGIQLVNLDDMMANDFADMSIEDIVEYLQGIDSPSRSRRYIKMMQAAEDYYRDLDKADPSSEEEQQRLRDRLDELVSAFGKDPAYYATLNVEREARLSRIGERNAPS